VLEEPRLDTPASLLERLRGTPAVVVLDRGVERPGAEPPAGVRLTGAPAGIAGAAGRVALLRGLQAAGEPLSPLYVRPPDALLPAPRRR
jgi:hypothetical protein